MIREKISEIIFETRDYPDLYIADDIADQILALPELEEHFKEKLRKEGWICQGEYNQALEVFKKLLMDKLKGEGWKSPEECRAEFMEWVRASNINHKKGEKDGKEHS